jgi:preprotein translocase subunit YajC
MFMQPTTAPGRDTSNPAPAQPASPGAPPADGGGPPPAGGGGPFGGMTMLLFPLLLVVMMLMMNRSQSKKQKQLESSLKVGDRIVTRSGIIGKIIDMGERTAKVEIAPGVNIQMLKTSIEGVDTPPDAKDAKDAKDGKDSKDAKAAESKN